MSFKFQPKRASLRDFTITYEYRGEMQLLNIQAYNLKDAIAQTAALLKSLDQDDLRVRNVFRAKCADIDQTLSISPSIMAQSLDTVVKRAMV